MSYYPNSGAYGAPGANYGPPGNAPAAPGGYGGYPPAPVGPPGSLPPQGIPQQGGYPAPQMGGGYNAPPGSAPAPAFGAPAVFNPAAAAPGSAFPAFRPPGAPAGPPGGPPGAPPASNYGAPGGSAPSNAPPASGRPSGVTFFSTSSGTPVPATAPAPSMMPPSSMPGGPPTGFGGPPMGGPPPPSGFGGVSGGMPPPPSGMSVNVAPPGPPGTGVPAGPYGSGGLSPAHAAGPPTMGAPGVPQGGPAYGGGGLYGNQNANSMQGMPTAFDSGTNLAGQGALPAGAAGPAGTAGSNANAQPPLCLIDEMDLSIQCNPKFLRATVGKIVSSQAAATNSRLPLGLVCKPMAGDVGTDNEDIEVVDFGATGIVRCKRCRTYINPYVTWADNGRRWRCNICGMQNDVPSTYFSHLDNNGQRRDRDQRPELSRASVEFVAPGDYMVRPPQPAVYFFVIDVSEPAIASGMLQHTANAIKAALDDIPGGDRTQIGFITFDAHIHFYNLNAKLTSPHMLVVSDVTDVILPLPEDILVNLAESRAVVEALLDALPTMFKQSSASPTSCTGPALNAAKRVIQHMGGKLLLFQSSLPTIGEGALKMRDNPRLLGSDKEHTLLNAEDPFYKTAAIEFSRVQVSVDTYLFSGQYTDLATLSVLSKYTSGSTYYYPAFLAQRDSAKYEHELHHNLVRATAFEAVMRVRATRGIRFSNFYGNYFIRGTDLLALPNCTSDSSFSLDMAYDETVLSAQAITIQAALLYTSAAGERRIRVHTMVIPVCATAAEMTESLDIDCTMNLLAKQAVEIAQKTGMENARQRVNQTTVDIMRSSRVQGGAAGGMPGQYGMPQQAAAPVQIPNCLLLLPLYSMSLQKSPVVRGGTDTRIDERAYFQQLLLNMDIEESKVFIYPRMFSLHDMTADTGLPSDNADVDDEVPTAGPNQVRLPAILNLSYERLSTNGLFLLENGHDLFMWIGRAVNPAIISTLFGVNSLEGVDMSVLKINPDNSDFSSRVDAVINALRQDRARYMQLHFIREGDGYAEAYFARYLIEDRANFSGGGMSYTEYHAHVTRAVSGMPGI